MTRGALALVALALVAAVVAEWPLRGDVLGLLIGIAGPLLVTRIVPGAERRMGLALCWTALSIALPLTIALTDVGFALALSLTLGAVGLWVVLARFVAARQIER